MKSPFSRLLGTLIPLSSLVLVGCGTSDATLSGYTSILDGFGSDGSLAEDTATDTGTTTTDTTIAADVPKVTDVGAPKDVQEPDTAVVDVQVTDVPVVDVQVADVPVVDIQTPDVPKPDVQAPDIQAPDIQTPDSGIVDAGGPAVDCSVTDYTKVQAIFTAECNGCHSHKFGNSCTTAKTSKGGLSGIKSRVTSGSMPPGGFGSTADKNLVLKWINDGALCTPPTGCP